jgi:hypothetical protein
VEAWIRQINARPSDRLRALAEVLVATRRLLAGEIVTSMVSAAATLRPIIARWGDLQFYPTLSEFVTCDENRRPVAASVALVGSAVTCVHGRALVDAGADAIVLVPIGTDPCDQIVRFLTEVVPLIA